MLSINFKMSYLGQQTKNFTCKYICVENLTKSENHFSLEKEKKLQIIMYVAIISITQPSFTTKKITKLRW